MDTSALRRVYCFSDTYGRSKNPFTQDDADAIISTDFRSFPLEFTKREFDIYGRENITAHVLRLIVELHEQSRKATWLDAATKAAFAKTITGVFINAAPRVSKEGNGSLFHVAAIGNLRIVTTDPAGLASIKEHVETIHHLPNLDNNLYGPNEQFRSSYAAVMLHPDHGLKLIENDPKVLIPDYPEDRWELSYVDRFGNMLTYCKNPGKKWDEVQEAAKETGGFVKLIVANVSQRVQLGSSLREAEPGGLVIYPNKDIEILRKWMEGEDSYTRLYRSAFFQFAKPELGAKIRVHRSANNGE
ncbi:MAG: hypothetical protein G01um101425_275 [Candidatus Peregrinibacteria bacterium Gr01-1014_25]|nr:MAG: hypothetical protein G01um101425_275 [Candidatus Peregrinibacteria bacterium Gr01-1014_25]